MSEMRNHPRKVRLIPFPLLLAACLLPLVACGDDDPIEPSGRTIEVEVLDFSFQPVMVNARVGDTIRWIQRDPVRHTATSGEPGTPMRAISSIWSSSIRETWPSSA